METSSPSYQIKDIPIGEPTVNLMVICHLTVDEEDCEVVATVDDRSSRGGPSIRSEIG